MKLALTVLTKLSDSNLDERIEDAAQELFQLRSERRRRAERKLVGSIIKCSDCQINYIGLCPTHDSLVYPGGHPI